MVFNAMEEAGKAEKRGRESQWVEMGITKLYHEVIMYPALVINDTGDKMTRNNAQSSY